MSSIHFKFRSGVEYEPLFFDGHCISLKDLRESIITKKKMGKANDFKLEVMDSTTEKEYLNENEMIPKNSSLIVRRVPIFYEKPKEIVAPKRQMDLSELAEIGNIAQVSASEESKLKAIMIQSELVTQHIDQPIEKSSCRVPICFHCKQTGHVIKNCPLIPKQVSLGKEPVHMFLKSSLGIPIEPSPPNKVEPQSEKLEEPPESFRCPICLSLMENAVLIPCCGASYCDNCIQNYLVDNQLQCHSCNTKTSPEHLIPNISLRKSLLDFQTRRLGKGKKINQSPPKEKSQPILVPSSSQVLTPLNNKNNFNKSLLSSLSLPRFGLPSPFLQNLKPFLSGQTIPSKLVPVSAPFVTAQYARSVSLGERILTRDEFYSLKSTLSREKKEAMKRDRERSRSSKSSSSRRNSRCLSKGRSRKRSTKNSHSNSKNGDRYSRSRNQYSNSPPICRRRSRSLSRDRRRDYRNSRIHR